MKAKEIMELVDEYAVLSGSVALCRNLVSFQVKKYEVERERVKAKLRDFADEFERLTENPR